MRARRSERRFLSILYVIRSNSLYRIEEARVVVACHGGGEGRFEVVVGRSEVMGDFKKGYLRLVG